MKKQAKTSAPVALVTGGAKRVGRAVIERLAAAGFDIAFTYFSSIDAADELIQFIRGMKRRAFAIRADFSKPPQAVRAISAAFSHHFDRLDVLVNNASVFEPAGLRDATLDQMRRFWAAHVESPLLLCRLFETQLRAARGHVINMCDILAERPRPEYLVYCASKAALASLTIGLAKELAPEVTVNGIAPGVVEWPDTLSKKQRDQYLKRVPLARAGTPADVAELVHFLATGAPYMTGQILRLDGGRSVT